MMNKNTGVIKEYMPHHIDFENNHIVGAELIRPNIESVVFWSPWEKMLQMNKTGVSMIENRYNIVKDGSFDFMVISFNREFI